jgi:hypothetical protein
MSQIKTKPRLANAVKIIPVNLTQLKAQAVGEVLGAYGLSAAAIKAGQSGALSGDYEAVSVLHRNASGRIVGRSNFNIGADEPGRTVNVVDREGQSALAALSKKAEALIAHDVRSAQRRGYTSEARFVIREGVDYEDAKRRHGLCDGEPIEFDGESYAKVTLGRDPSSSIEVQRARRRKRTSEDGS